MAENLAARTRRTVRLILVLCGVLVATGALSGASWGAAQYDPSTDVNSMASTTAYTGA